MTLVKVALIGLSAFVLVGCSDARKEAVYGMYDALGDGNIEKLQKHTTEVTSGLLVMAATMKCGENPSSFSSQENFTSHCLEKMFSKTDVEDVKITEVSENAAYATVTTETDGKATTEKLDLAKVDGAWKVNIHK